MWGMSVRKVTSLGSKLASVTDIKRIQTPHGLFCDFRSYKTFRTRWVVGQVAEFNFGSKIEPLPFIWQSLLRLFQNVIEGSEGKINGQALGVALQLCLGGLDRQAQTQGVS